MERNFVVEHQQIMASNLRCLIVWFACVVLALESASGIRTYPRSMSTPASSADGICSSRVEIFGYECEEHTVTTEDGYILSIQRIPNGRSGSTAGGNKAPVLLQHGLMMDGTAWLLNSPDESLAYILADDGFDVWIANTRGTINSQGHTSLSPDDPEYWDWSWDELVDFDLPATFGYVYGQTGQKIHYVGHSLGTLIALASFSQQKLLNMIRSAALLSPIAYLGQVSSALGKAANDAFIAEDLYWLGIYEFIPRGKVVNEFLKKLCDQPGIDCYDLFTAITGKNCCLNSSSVDVFLDHEPQPTSTKNMVHLAQMNRRGMITKYDYNDDEKNMEHYGQVTPPAYHMSIIPDDLPLFFSYGGQDYLSDVQDVHLLLDGLNSHNGNKLTVQYQEDYAHIDFVMAFNAKQVIYDPLMAFFKLQ